MIPIQLELKNFLSYRKTAVLDFAGLHLACISGLNGAGKSSILDAITWVLFGQSRAKSDDDLVNRIAAHNNKGAEVTLTFALNKTVYRVIRFKKVKRTQKLELQIKDADSWKTITESKVRETQQAIERLLNMNYELFASASFFLQGEADRFTTQHPTQRKQILAQLLGVNQWDQYKETTALIRKQTEGSLNLLDGRLHEIELELGERSERESKLATVEAEWQLLQEHLKQQSVALDHAREREQRRVQLEQQLKQFQTQQNQAQLTLKNVQDKSTARKKERTNYQTILDQASSIEEQHISWLKADASWQLWQEKTNKLQKLEATKRPLELALARATSERQTEQAQLLSEQKIITQLELEQSSVQEKIKENEQSLSQLTLHLTQFDTISATLLQYEKERQQIEHDQTTWRQQIAQLKETKDKFLHHQIEYPKLVTQQETMTNTLSSLENELNELSLKRIEHSTLAGQIQQLQNDQPHLKEQMDAHMERINTLGNETGGDCPLCGQQLTDTHRQQVILQLQEEGTELGDQYRTNRTKIKQFTTQTEQLSLLLNQSPKLEKKLRRQQQEIADLNARIEEIKRELSSWSDQSETDYNALQAKLTDDKQLKELDQQILILRQKEKEREQLRLEIAQLKEAQATQNARLIEIERRVTNWQTAQKPRLEQLTIELDTAQFNLTERTEISSLEKEILDLAYDPQQAEEATTQRQTLSSVPNQYQQLKQAEAAVAPLDQTIVDLSEQIKQIEENLTYLNEQATNTVTELTPYQENQPNLTHLSEQLNDLRTQEGKLNQQLGAVRQRVAILSDQEEIQSRLQGDRAELTRRIERLRRLEKACGRDGVQALLIEQALPFIEDAANNLLQRLTGGEMNISFKTQKELKTKKTMVETLEIEISDHSGYRPYENYSGGEQFRINFAIRIALSQLLSSRAGARLQTLVIDEGFGTQDPEGRQKLVESINLIQHDYALILVITHIDELKNAFPAQIEISKTPSGSQFQIIEN